MNLSKRYARYWIACSLLLGAGYLNRVQAQESKAISISLVPQIGFNYSYYHLSSKSYRDNFRITTHLGDARTFYMGLGLQLGLWNEWKATLIIAETYNGGDQAYNFSKFTNLPQDATATFIKDDHQGYAFPVGLCSFNFSKKVWRFKMGAIKGINLASELDVLFGAGVLWINGSIYKDGVFSDYRPLSNAWQVSNDRSFVATPANSRICIINVGFIYNVLINNKARFVFGAEYTYGLQASYDVAYKSTYAFDNFATHYHESSVEDFNAETGRHQFTLSIGYPIALYRNKAANKVLEEEASHNLK